MKNNIFKLAFVAMAATALFLSCNKEKDNDSAIQKPVMVTLSADDFFTEAKANVTATLTEAQDHDVVVTLAYRCRSCFSWNNYYSCRCNGGIYHRLCG